MNSDAEVNQPSYLVHGPYWQLQGWQDRWTIGALCGIEDDGGDVKVALTLVAGLLLQGHIVELNVIVPNGPEAGQDLGERGHDQFLSMSAKAISAIRYGIVMAIVSNSVLSKCPLAS